MQHIKHYSLGLFVVFALLLGALISAQPALAMTGDGTSANPYKIATADDLRAFAAIVNGTGTDNQTAQPNAWAVLTADINLNPGASYDPTKETWINGDGQPVAEDSLHKWTPIGNYSNNFTGTFDGGGNTVSGLYISNSDEDFLGLFGWVGDSGTVKNLTVSGSVSGGDVVGGIVGVNEGNVIDCSNNCSVKDSTETSRWVGGVAGQNYGSVIDCSNTGCVKGSPKSVYVGGIIGENHGSVSGCSNTGSVSGNMYAGGVTGGNSASVSSCSNSGGVSCSDITGGVVGFNSIAMHSDVSISSCSNSGSVSGSNIVGGVAGVNYDQCSVSSCSNSGSVSGNGYIGGVVGNDTAGTVSDCYWLETVADLGIGNYISTDVTDVEPKTVDEFASGEVAWLLQDAIDEEQGQVWGQQLSGGGKDDWPVLTSDESKAVYEVTVNYGSYEGAPTSETFYSNDIDDPGRTPIREGYTLTGWTKETSGRRITFTAQWMENITTYTVIVSANPAAGGTVKSSVESAPSGTEVTVTATPARGYHFVGWMENDTTVSGDASYTFSLEANRTLIAIFEQDQAPTPDPTPTPDPDPSGPSTGESDGWESIADEITAADDGDSITIDMNGETEVPADIFEDAVGKDVDLVFDMGDGLSWSVNGQDIPEGTNLTDLDLGVDLGTDGIPVEVINAITGENDSVQITLAYDGDFGFTLTLTAPLGEDNAGYWANLYHYDEDAETLDFETAAEIGADGRVSLPLSHASQYAIVIDDHSHAATDVSEIFTDVPANHWAQAAIQYAYDNGLMTGVSVTEFCAGSDDDSRHDRLHTGAAGKRH